MIWNSGKPVEIFWSVFAALSLIYLGAVLQIYPVSIYFSCLPVILLILRFGYEAGILGLVSTGILLAITGRFLGMPLVFTLTYLLVSGPLCLVMGYLIRSGKPAFRVISISTLLCSALVFAWIPVVELVFNQKPLEAFYDTMERNNSQAIEIYRDKQDFDEEQLGLMEETLAGFSEFVRIVFPALLILFSFVGVGVTYLIGIKVFSGYGVKLKRLPNFSGWRPAEELVWGLILGGILYFWGRYRGPELIRIIGMNISIPFLALYFIAGLSVGYYIFRKFRVFLLLAGIGYMFMIILNPLYIGALYYSVLGMGLIDVWYDFRRKIEKRIEKNKSEDRSE